MAKKKKGVVENPTFTQEVPEIKDCKLLKVDQEVYYRTPYIAEKTRVIEVDKKAKIAILENQVKVFIGILPNNHLMKVGTTNDAQEVRLWDEAAEDEIKLIGYKHLINALSNELIRSANKLSKAKIMAIGKRFTKINEILQDDTI